METKPRGWPAETKSIFTDGSSEDTNQTFRDDPFLGCHKHGPACVGDVRAVVYPISSEARICCEAEPKEEDASPHLVKLRACEESTYFTIGTSLCGNVTMRFPDLIEESDNDWKHQIQARIYPDPDSNDAELFNGSPSLSISVSAAGNRTMHSIHPGKCFRLKAGRSWTMRMTKIHTFGLILGPAPDLLEALNQHVLHYDNRNFEFPGSRKALWKQSVERGGTGNDTRELVPQARHISLPDLPIPFSKPLFDKTFETEVALKAISSSLGDGDLDAIILFENRLTTVEEYGHQDKRRVRKTIRSTQLHRAAVQWEKETQTLSRLLHPHIIEAIKWNPAKLSIDFEHGGKDLASLRNATNMFDVAVHRVDVQERIWVHATAALEYLHDEMRIKHLDVKPQNILLSDDHQTAKLCDFGHARDIDEAVRGGGTHYYIAPEFLLSSETSAASDIWALGITMLYVLNVIPLPGSEPDAEIWQIHKLKDDKKERRKMRKWLRTVAEAKSIIPSRWSLLSEMLDQDPETRITAKVLTQKLKNMMRGKSQHRNLLVA